MAPVADPRAAKQPSPYCADSRRRATASLARDRTLPPPPVSDPREAKQPRPYRADSRRSATASFARDRTPSPPPVVDPLAEKQTRPYRADSRRGAAASLARNRTPPPVAGPPVAKQPSPYPLPPALPIPEIWGYRHPFHNRAESRRRAASLTRDRAPPPPELGLWPVLPSSLASAAKAEQATTAAEKKIEWPTFSISLTPEEIEEDIITGNRPRRQPKKRKQALLEQLDVSPKSE